MEIKSKDLLEFVKSVKSAKTFIPKKLNQNVVKEILEFGRWVPFDNQPWKINVVSHPTIKRMLAELTPLGETIESAYFDLVIFLDSAKCTDRVKDLQATGAFVQNILLGIHAMPPLGAIWITDIQSNKKEVDEIFRLNLQKFELMGIIAIGLVEEKGEMKESAKKKENRPLDELTESF